MLKNLREQKGMTQTELSYITGISIKTISRIENGDENVNYSTIKKLAQFFNIEVVDIYKK